MCISSCAACRTAALPLQRAGPPPAPAPALRRFSEVIVSAIQESGALFVAAAGNDGKDLEIANIYPALYDLPNLLAVAATT